MDAHPGVVFRDGPAGRRAVLIGGPDVWEVVRAVKDVRDANPGVVGDAALDLVEELTGVSRRLVSVAVAYWGAYPAEVDATIADAEASDAELLSASQRSRSLLGA